MERHDFFGSLSLFYSISKLTGASCFTVEGNPYCRIFKITRMNKIIFFLQIILFPILFVLTVRQRVEEIGNVELEHFPELFLIFYYFVLVSTIICSQYFNSKNIFLMYSSLQNICKKLIKFKVFPNYSYIARFCKFTLSFQIVCLCSVYCNLQGYENLYILVFYNFSDLVSAFFTTQVIVLLYTVCNLIQRFNKKIIEETSNKKSKKVKIFLNNFMKIHGDFYELCVVINRNFDAIIILIFMTSWALIYVLFKSALEPTYGYDFFLWCLDNVIWNVSNFFCTLLVILVTTSTKYEVKYILFLNIKHATVVYYSK